MNSIEILMPSDIKAEFTDSQNIVFRVPLPECVTLPILLNKYHFERMREQFYNSTEFHAGHEYHQYSYAIHGHEHNRRLIVSSLEHPEAPVVLDHADIDAINAAISKHQVLESEGSLYFDRNTSQLRLVKADGEEIHLRVLDGDFFMIDLFRGEMVRKRAMGNGMHKVCAFLNRDEMVDFTITMTDKNDENVMVAKYRFEVCACDFELLTHGKPIEHETMEIHPIAS